MTQSAEYDRYTVTDISTEKNQVMAYISALIKKAIFQILLFVRLAKKTTVLQMHRHRAINPVTETYLKAHFGTFFYLGSWDTPGLTGVTYSFSRLCC